MERIGKGCGCPFTRRRTALVDYTICDLDYVNAYDASLHLLQFSTVIAWFHQHKPQVRELAYANFTTYQAIPCPHGLASSLGDRSSSTTSAIDAGVIGSQARRHELCIACFCALRLILNASLPKIGPSSPKSCTAASAPRALHT